MSEDFIASNGYAVMALDDGQICLTKPVHGSAFETKMWMRPDEATAIIEYLLQGRSTEKAPPPPELPTEPGAIIWWEEKHLSAIAVLEKTDQWLCNWDADTHTNAEVLSRLGDASFTRLAPEAETANNVLTRVAQITMPAGNVSTNWESRLTGKQLRQVAAEFGVSL